jgi:RNA polymerase sigma-70 factor, ECF subfamily
MVVWEGGLVLDEVEINHLLGRCALGDRAAFRNLYDEAAPKLFGVSLRILGHRGDAEEATQEAFVRIWQKADRYRPDKGSGPGWIVAIARNAAIDRLRMRRAPTRDIADMVDLADPGPGPEAAAAASDDRRRIEGCLGELPVDRAKAVRAAYLDGHTYEELARTFEVPLNTMRTWLRRALIALRKCLDPVSDRP